MTATPQASLLADGRRLHLHHGPIDLILEVFGADHQRAYARATDRFQSILTGLVAELPALRRPLEPGTLFADLVARRMGAAVAPHSNIFVTPMAAVAGAVADEMLATLIDGTSPDKAYVNNGGDIAFYLATGASLAAHAACGAITIAADDPARGLATSGWRGRSHSLGIADAVTVAAPTAAAADVAATLIANAVDLPGHSAIHRLPACDLSPDSDLGARLVTVNVGLLSRDDIATALARGETAAHRLCAQGSINQVALSLCGQTRQVLAYRQPTQTGALAHV